MHLVPLSQHSLNDAQLLSTYFSTETSIHVFLRDAELN